jgi:hypothetical protein
MKEVKNDGAHSIGLQTFRGQMLGDTAAEGKKLLKVSK